MTRTNYHARTGRDAVLAAIADGLAVLGVVRIAPNVWAIIHPDHA